MKFHILFNYLRDENAVSWNEYVDHTKKESISFFQETQLIGEDALISYNGHYMIITNPYTIHSYVNDSSTSLKKM